MGTDAQGRHILVVDDDEVMREVLSALLEVQGYRVMLAASGESAVEMLPGFAPSAELILTDVQLPGLRGEALIAALREAAPEGALILGMSGSLPPETVLSGLDGFLLKPFEAAQVEDAMRAAQAASHTPGASRPQGARNASENGNGAESAGTWGSSEPPPSESPLNEAIFSKLADTLQPGPLHQLYTMTLDDVTRRHARMVEYAASGDLEAVQREAHAIKGACGFVGARELHTLAGTTEGSASMNISAISEFPAACLRLRRMLDSKLKLQ